MTDKKAGKRILIVDDDPSVREVVGRFLKAESYEVLFAEDGLEGLERARTFLPDLVVVDVLMPHMDGVSFCSMMKREARTARIPVLFLTGQGNLGTAEQAMAEGAQGFLTKPLDYRRFIEKIEALLKS